MSSEASFLLREPLRQADPWTRKSDQSFAEVKAIVRKKLGLDANAKLGLVQLRDGREVDLEDGAPH